MHIHWNLKEIQEKNGWSDDERRKRSDALIQELHKKIPELLRWGESSRGFDYPQIELGYMGAETDKEGAPLWLAVRKLTHQPEEIIRLVGELGDKHLS